MGRLFDRFGKHFGRSILQARDTTRDQDPQRDSMEAVCVCCWWDLVGGGDGPVGAEQGMGSNDE